MASKRRAGIGQKGAGELGRKRKRHGLVLKGAGLLKRALRLREGNG